MTKVGVVCVYLQLLHPARSPVCISPVDKIPISFQVLITPPLYVLCALVIRLVLLASSLGSPPLLYTS